MVTREDAFFLHEIELDDFLIFSRFFLNMGGQGQGWKPEGRASVRFIIYVLGLLSVGV